MDDGFVYVGVCVDVVDFGYVCDFFGLLVV